jgi:uncharacterized protein involved in oxidation of intracellular sulfur
MVEKKEKIIFIVTAGPDDPQRMTFPFMLATAAQSVDVEAVVVFQGDSVLLAKKGVAEHIKASGLAKLKDLMDSYVQAGGTILLCGPCIKDRNLSEQDFIQGTRITAAAQLVNEILSANATLVY